MEYKFLQFGHTTDPNPILNNKIATFGVLDVITLHFLFYLQVTTMFKCFYCEKECTCFPDIINHLIEHHPHDEIKFKKQEDNKIKHVSFKVIPELCREQGRLITLNETENKILWLLSLV